MKAICVCMPKASSYENEQVNNSCSNISIVLGTNPAAWLGFKNLNWSSEVILNRGNFKHVSSGPGFLGAAFPVCLSIS